MRMKMSGWRGSVGFAMGLTLSLSLALSARAAEPRPSVLFIGAPNVQDAALPLHELGIELDTCVASNLAAKLASKKYNVVVPYVQYDKSLQKVLEDFMAAGGGVFLTMPFGHISRQGDWFPNPEWAADQGARIRWETLADSDTNNAFVDSMGAPLSWSSQVSAPVNEGVSGVLTLVGRLGWWPPVGVDFGPDWQVVVRHAPSVKGVKPDIIPERLRAYVTKEVSTNGPALMGIRSMGKGRMALTGIGANWCFTGPGNCPTVRAMMVAGEKGKTSNWARIYANTFRWLAEPSMKAGWGGATTPEKVLVSSDRWPDHAPIDWANLDTNTIPPMQDQPQLNGLVGARTALSSGSGTVADYVKAAKAANLDFLVFLEDSLKMDAAKFAALVEQCTAASDDSFAAIPGLTFEDAQGNHFFTCGDNTKFPKPEMVLPDGRLATLSVSRTEVMFKYIFEYMNYRNAVGYWRHKENFLPIADNKLYNSFPIYSFEDGKPVDSSFEDYKYLMGLSGCHALFALEMMSGPDQVARRAAEGWRLVSAIDERFGDGSYVQSLPPGVAGLRKKWTGSLGWYPPFQYITSGPKILSWSCQNICAIPNGEWWRPDVWEYRARLHVSSDAGLKSVTVYDGDRGVYRRWLLNGAKEFTHEFILANSQQRDLFPVVEDMKGGRAIGMEVWNRNTQMNQFICGDRCNFLGNCRLRRKDGTAIWIPCGFKPNMGITPSKGSMGDALGMEPAVALTANWPTLPIDGAPQSLPSPRIEIGHAVPGEYRELFAYPITHLVSPEWCIGQADYKLAYDPAENGAKTTPLGHAYKDPEKQGHIGKNAWTSWFKLIPTQVLGGWSRIHSGPVLDAVRFGGYEAHLVMKQDVALDPTNGVGVLNAPGTWEIYENGKPVALPGQNAVTGVLGKGSFALTTIQGGSVALIGTGDNLRYKLGPRSLSLFCLPPDTSMKKGQVLDLAVKWMGASGTLSKDQLLGTLKAFGVSAPGSVGYTAKLKRGKTVDTYLQWRTAAENGALEASVAKAGLLALVPLVVEGLNDNWSVWLLDRKRANPNFRALPVRDGLGYAQLDPTDGDLDLFVGHPVTCDQPDVKLLVSWQEAGLWFVEAHNAGEKPVKAVLTSNAGWTKFKFKESVDLPAGSSKVWRVKEK